MDAVLQQTHEREIMIHNTVLKAALLSIVFTLLNFSPCSLSADIIDGFGNGPLVGGNQGTRLRMLDSGNWHALTNTNWDLSNGVLSVTPVANGGYDPVNQGPIATMVDNTDGAITGTSITVSFDYDAGEGELYFHLRGADDATGNLNWDLNLNSGFGHMYDADFGGDMGRYDLTDGETVNTDGNNPGESRGFRDHTISLSGSGKFSATYDISGYAVSELGDYEWFAVGFSHNGAGTDPVEISNILITAVPEPGSFAIIALIIAGLTFHRRR